MLQYLVTFKGFFQCDERILQLALDAVWFLKTLPKYLVNQNRELGGIKKSFIIENIYLWSLQVLSPVINLQLKQNIQDDSTIPSTLCKARSLEVAGILRNFQDILFFFFYVGFPLEFAVSVEKGMNFGKKINRKILFPAAGGRHNPRISHGFPWDPAGWGTRTAELRWNEMLVLSHILNFCHLLGWIYGWGVANSKIWNTAVERKTRDQL